jgi:hypothetical protein
MATQVQFRRGTTTENNAFTGAVAEITVDTTIDTIRVHDGSNAGGMELLNISSAQSATNKTLGSGCTWQGNDIGLAYGGTGSSLSVVQGAVAYCTASGIELNLAGTAGQILTSGGTSAPIWVTPSNLTVGTATTATNAGNIDGGSAGYLVYQVEEDVTGFIQPGTSGYVLKSNGASTAPGWVTSDFTVGSTAVALGATETDFTGISTFDITGTTGSTSTSTGALTVAGGAGIGENLYVGGNIVLTGDLTVNGTTTTINSTELVVDDLNITVASGSTNAAAANGAGLTVDCGSDTDATLIYDGNDDQWEFNKNVDVTGTITASGAVVMNSTVDIANLLSADGGIDVDGVMTISNSSGNISTTGTLAAANTTISGTLDTTGLASLDGGIDVDGAFTVANASGNISTTGTLAVTGTTTLTGALAANGGITVDSTNFTVDGTSGAVTTASTIEATGAITSSAGISGTTGSFSSDVTVTGDLAVNGGDITSSTGAISFDDENLSTTGTLATGAQTITGDVDLNGNLDVSGNITSSSGAISFGDENLSTTGTLSAGNTSVGTLDASGLASLDGGIDVDGAFTVANTSGNISTTGTLNVTGTTTLDDVSASYIDLTPADPGPSHNEGRLFYHDEYKAFTYYNDISGISNQLGLEEWIRVYNNTGSTISNGTPVYVTGASGETPTVAPADATTVTKARVIGVATHDITNSSEGIVTVRGLVSGIDTSALTAGQPVHVAADGSLQTAAPTYPYFPTDVGGCIVSDATNGYLYVRILEHSLEQFRVTGNTHMGGNLTIDGNLTVNGSQSIASQTNLSITDSFIYLNGGDTIGEANTSFSGSGLDDAYLAGHYKGTTTTTYYVRIDGVGTGTGGVDTFEWSKDNFSTTEATGVDIDTAGVTLDNGIKVMFNASTGHTSSDTWSGTAAPLNVDTGWFTNRNTGTSGVGYTHMGIFYDVTDSKFKVVDEYDPEPEGTINTGHASYNAGTLVADTFEGTLVGAVTGNVTGNAATATSAGKWTTARTITLGGDLSGNVSIDGSSNVTLTATVADDSHNHVTSNIDGLAEYIADTVGGMVTSNTESGISVVYQDADNTLDFTIGTLNQNTTGNAATATALQTARTIGGVSFDGTANINLPGVNTTGNQDTTGNAATASSCSGNAATATKWATARTVTLSGAVTGSASVDGSANVTITTTATSDPTLTINGDASGSATFTNLGNATLTLTIADDSHNHTIANVDGLQTALDGKLSTSGKAADSDLLDGISSGSFLRSDAADVCVSGATIKDNTGNYGSFEIDGGATGGYEGYSIGGRSVFMHNNTTTHGIYDDVNNQWMIKGVMNAATDLYYAGSSKLTTASGGVTVSGSLTASSNVTAYSDVRLKSNIATIENPLDKVLALRGVNFTKDDKYEMGVIAQEVEEVIPEVVKTEEDEMGTKSVAYGNMVGLLIEAIKEQQKQIDELKAKLGE